MLAGSDREAAEAALLYVQSKGMDLGEARPELGHATNGSVIIGRRELTQGTFLARRAFLPSYDPFNDDERGSNLEGVITPALVVCSGISLEYLFSTVEGGAGTKVALNIVGEHSVMQGASGDVHIGLPTQMTELHSPMRALFVVDAPVVRVQAVLSRNDVLKDLVHNEWVRFVVRDPTTGAMFRQQNCGQYIPIAVTPDMPPADPSIPNERNFVPCTQHLKYATHVTNRESAVFVLALAIVAASIVAPIYAFDSLSLNPIGACTAIAFTALSLLILGFSRRYLHAEFMFDRFVLLSAVLVGSLNLVALAPTLKCAMVGWNVMGWSWAFLVGSFSERPTVRDNATFVFCVSQLSDAGLTLAVSLENSQQPSYVVAFGLLVSALLKTSQFPVLSMFQRGMECCSPCSALGDAVVCAHCGVILLATTMPHWFPLNAARVILASIGAATAVLAGLVAQIRGDRKGSLGHIVAATVGVLYVLLAQGYVVPVLALAFGHATTRAMQILRAHNLILEHHELRGEMQGAEAAVHPTPVADALFRVCWAINRFATDVRLPHVMHWLPACVRRAVAKAPHMTSHRQYALVVLLLAVGGAPFTPIAHLKMKMLIAAYQTRPLLAVCAHALVLLISMVTVWLVFHRVLDEASRFHHARLPKQSARHQDSEVAAVKKVPSEAGSLNDLSQQLLGA